MYTYNINFITNFNKILIYIENNLLFLYGKVLTKKIKLHNIENLFLDNTALEAHTNIYNISTNKQYALKASKLQLNLLRSLFNQTIYLNKSKLKLRGRGYKLYNYTNNLAFKLGYSHMLFYYMMPNMLNKYKKKKLKYYTFYSTNKTILNNMLSGFSDMRVPHYYTKKGIFFVHNSL